MLKIFRTLYTFSSKRTERITKKLQEAEMVASSKTFDSVADQETFSEDKLVALIDERKEFVRKLNQDTTIPKQAIYVGIATLAPLALLSTGAMYCCVTPEYCSYAYQLMQASLKYAAINISFQAGIHWGFAMSMHECQMDWLKSSSDARWHFILASLPLFASIVLIAQFVYGKYDELKVSTGIAGLIGLNVVIWMLDLKSRRHSPGWYLKSKIFYGFGYQICLMPLLAGNFKRKEDFKVQPSIYRLQ